MNVFLKRAGQATNKQGVSNDPLTVEQKVPASATRRPSKATPAHNSLQRDFVSVPVFSGSAGGARYFYSDAVSRRAEGHGDEFRISDPGESLETEADRTATAVTRGERLPEQGVSKPPDSPNRLTGQPGQPLEAKLRTEMESDFGADFSSVRVHTGPEADALSKGLGARAVAHENHIYLKSGEYRPDSLKGRWLLAHELTHTLQAAENKAAGSLMRNVVEFEEHEGLQVTVSEARTARLLRRAGWRQIDVSVLLRDFLNRPMRNHAIAVQFQAPGYGPSSPSGFPPGGIVGGVQHFSGVWARPSGSVRVMAFPLVGSPTLGGFSIEGTVYYRLPARGTGIRLEGTQRHREVTVTAATREEAARTAGVSGTAGVNFSVVSLGGSMSSERSETSGRSMSRTWKVFIPTEAFDLRQVT